MNRTHFRLHRRVPLLDRVVYAAIAGFVLAIAFILPGPRPMAMETSRAILWVQDHEVVMVVRESAEHGTRLAPPRAAAFPQQLP